MPTITVSVTSLRFRSESFGSRASDKLGEWLSDWVCDLCSWASSTMEAMKEKNWHKGSLGDEDDAQTSNTQRVQRKRVIPHSTMKTHRSIVKCVVITLTRGRHIPASVLRRQHQPKAFALDLCDDQSRYLFRFCAFIIAQSFKTDLHSTISREWIRWCVEWLRRSTRMENYKHKKNAIKRAT